jgi:hypothetical protein
VRPGITIEECLLPLRIFVSPQAINKNVKIKYTKLILPVALCGRETWSLTLREEHRPRVFDYRMQRKIYRPKWKEVTRRKEITECGAS